jgi:hypothetical protein
MPSRQPYWCVAEISKDGTINPISPHFEYDADAEERKNELLAKEEYQGKNLQVVKAAYPVDPRNPPRRRENR